MWSASCGALLPSQLSGFLVEESALNKRSSFKSPGVIVVLSIAVLILIVGLFYGYGRILWILGSAGAILLGVGVFVYFSEKKGK